jgi:two-component system, NtrC family, nitrogen regulation sensor histidine kinase NtrY
MIFKNFRINIIVRIIILVATIFLFFLSLKTNYHITPFLVGAVILFEVFTLIRYVDRTNRDLTSFLESIRFAEFTRSFKIQGMGSSFDELNRAFNDVINDFQKVRSEKEEHFHYLQSIVQNIDVAILAYRKDGTIEMINKASKKLFQIHSLKNINGLGQLSPELVNTLLHINPGENALVKVQDQDDILQLAIHSTEFKIKDKLIILSTINNIQNVLEEQETEAWQKLIRVLTHEIMNSITPIASLSSTLEIMLKGITESGNIKEELDINTAMEILQALQTINKRSTGLLHFVNTYRNLTRIPKPNFKIFPVSELFKNIYLLMEEELKASKINFITKIEPENLMVSADDQLIEQVVINLIRNSIHALENRDNPTIELKAFYNKRGRVTMQVTDNGTGILPEVLDKIFIPFFTTKQSGSGIGLSLSRQILRLHNGTISAYSVPEKETIFTMTF